MKTIKEKPAVIYRARTSADPISRIVYAATLHCFSRFEKAQKAELSLNDRLSLAEVFEQVEAFVRDQVRMWGFEGMKTRIALKVMISQIDRGYLPEVDALLSTAIGKKVSPRTF